MRFNVSLHFVLVLMVWVVLGSVVSGCDADDDSPSSDSGGTGDDDSDDDADDDAHDDDATDDDTWPPLPDDDSDDDSDLPPTWLIAKTGAGAGIFDGLGRQVILRGMNFNHLGDYFETDPSLPTVAELSAEDWDDAAATGANVVRLVTSWSAWQPDRDTFDEDYLDCVREAVADANARGIRVVIDMHQDAWSKFVFTPVGESCPAGTSHQRGWDGAPEWATFTDGEPTCTPGRREESPAVIRAWDNFYANRDGVRDELAALWGRIATEFADEPGVAGYDLLNEPGNGADAISTALGLTAFYRSALESIRDAEDAAGSPGHIVFFETSVDGVPPAFSFREENTVFAPHNYFASILPGPDWLIDVGFALYDVLGRIYGAAVWVGEYNSFSDPATNEAWTARYAALDDRYIQAGGTWWQWEQECGDPHNVMYPPTPEWIAAQQASCGNARFAISTCLRRGFPRAAPGRITRIDATPCLGDVTVEGSTDEAGVADLWLPSESDTPPAVTGIGIEDFTAQRVGGGWRIDVTVSGDYVIEASPEN